MQDDTWDVKGRFDTAIHDHTPVEWEMTSDGKYTLSLLAVSLHFIYYTFFLIV